VKFFCSAMKNLVVFLTWCGVAALELHAARQNPSLKTLGEEELLTVLRHRISICENGSDLFANVTTDQLLEEFKRREEMKLCPPTAPAPAPEPHAASPVSGPSVAPGPGTTRITTTTTTGPDNFADELVDQANVQFTMLDKNQDGCIDASEMTQAMKAQVQQAKRRNYYWQLGNITRAGDAISNALATRVSAADSGGDGCLTKSEFLVLRHAIGECSNQFMMMDHNGDGKVSQQEAATFVSDHMDHADLSYDKLRNIFQTSDVNGDKYLSEQEFCESGPRFKGDGDDK